MTKLIRANYTLFKASGLYLIWWKPFSVQIIRRGSGLPESGAFTTLTQSGWEFCCQWCIPNMALGVKNGCPGRFRPSRVANILNAANLLFPLWKRGIEGDFKTRSEATPSLPYFIPSTFEILFSIRTLIQAKMAFPGEIIHSPRIAAVHDSCLTPTPIPAKL